MTGNAQIAHETPMPFRLTVAVLMLDIVTEWTLNALLTTSSSYRKCSKRRILDHSAQATSLLPIGGTTSCSRIARGFGSGSDMAFVAALSLRHYDYLNRELNLPHTYGEEESGKRCAKTDRGRARPSLSNGRRLSA